MKRTKFIGVVVFVLATSLSLFSCGGDEDNTGEEQEIVPVPKVEERTVSVNSVIGSDDKLTDNLLIYKLISSDEAKVVGNNGEVISVTIPSNIVWMGHTYKVTIIDNSAFYSLHSLCSVETPNSIDSIGACAFAECENLTSVKLADGVRSIGFFAFRNCRKLTSVNIPNSVKYMSGAFENCSSLTSVTIPNSVTDISGAFGGCSSLTSITIPKSVTDISGAFRGCSSLTSITIPNRVTNISDAFENCNRLTSITIPNSVTDISGAFRGCSSLTIITIPDNVTTIAPGTFYGCKNLQTLNVEGKIPPCYSTYGYYNKENKYYGLFYYPDNEEGRYDNYIYNYKSSYYSKVTLHVPAGCKEIYSKSEPWNHFENIIDDL